LRKSSADSLHSPVVFGEKGATLASWLPSRQLSANDLFAVLFCSAALPLTKLEPALLSEGSLPSTQKALLGSPQPHYQSTLVFTRYKRDAAKEQAAVILIFITMITNITII
jgi:hypothetical protein